MSITAVRLREQNASRQPGNPGALQLISSSHYMFSAQNKDFLESPSRHAVKSSEHTFIAYLLDYTYKRAHKHKCTHTSICREYFF